MQIPAPRTLGLAAAAAVLAAGGLAIAADHAEAPGTQADPAADIADLYAWHDGTKVTAVLTYGGLQPAGGAALYDDQVLYGLHIDNNGDQVADHDVWIRFGQNSGGAWGVQVTDLAGGDPLIQGPVDTMITDSTGLNVWAGNADDPFFFDLQGFNDTLASGTLSFDSTRDSLAGTNVSAIVVEMDAATAHGGTDTFDIWATSARL